MLQKISHCTKYKIILFLVLVMGSPACALQTGSPQPQEANKQRSGTDNQAVPIYLAIGAFDPLSEPGPPGAPPEMTLESYPEDEPGYYILQFKGPVLQKWKDDVLAAGARIFDYIPQFAFLVKMDQETLAVVKTMASVRWVGIYQPGYRIAPNLMAVVTGKTDQRIEVLVLVFSGESIPPLTSAIERLGGEILVVSGGEEKIRLRIGADRITDLSRLIGIRYIERAPEFRLFPRRKMKERVE